MITRVPCDFCDDVATEAFLAAGFEQEDVNGRGGVLISPGYWAVCSTCQLFIDEGDWASLARRALSDSWNSYAPADRLDMQVHLLAIHQEFIRARTVPCVPIKEAQRRTRRRKVLVTSQSSGLEELRGWWQKHLLDEGGYL